MIIIRESFTAKPGMASKLAKLMKSMTNDAKHEIRVMTDLTGPFNTVVMETEIDRLSDMETRMSEYISDPEMKTKMSGYTDMYTKGRREIFQVLA